MLEHSVENASDNMFFHRSIKGERSVLHSWFFALFPLSLVLLYNDLRSLDRPSGGNIFF
jgi:hypothetical protein